MEIMDPHLVLRDERDCTVKQGKMDFSNKFKNKQNKC